MRREFFIFDRAVLLQHFHVVGVEGIGEIAGKDLMIGTTNDLAGVQFEQFLKAAVDKQEPAVQVFHVDDGGRVVGDFREQLFASMNGFLGAFAIHDGLEGARHANDASFGIPDRLAARPDPMIIARFREQPIFHIVRECAVPYGP